LTFFRVVSSGGATNKITRTTTTNPVIWTNTLGSRGRNNGHITSTKTTQTHTNRIGIVSGIIEESVVSGIISFVSSQRVVRNEITIFRAVGIKSSIFIFLRKTPGASTNIILHSNLVTVVLTTLITTPKFIVDTRRARAISTHNVRIDINLRGVYTIIISPLVTGSGALNTSAGFLIKIRPIRALVRVEGAIRALTLIGVTEPRILLLTNEGTADVLARRTGRAIHTSEVALFRLALARGALNLGAGVNTVTETRKTDRITNLILVSTVLNSGRTGRRDGVFIATRAVASPLSSDEVKGVGLSGCRIIIPVAQSSIISITVRRSLQGIFEWCTPARTRSETFTALRIRTSNLKDSSFFVDRAGARAVVDSGITPGAARASKLIGAIDTGARIVRVLEEDILEIQSFRNLRANIFSARNASLVTTSSPIGLLSIDTEEDGRKLVEISRDLEFDGQHDVSQSDRGLVITTDVVTRASFTSTWLAFYLLLRGETRAVHLSSIH